MQKFLITILAFLIISPQTLAAGRIFANPNEDVVIRADSQITNGDYKWTIMKGDQVVGTKASNTFLYRFADPATYDVNLSVTDPATQVIENTSVEVLIGQAGRVRKTLKPVIQTIPARSADGVVHLVAPASEVTFFSASSQGNIKEFHIDSNIFRDSNGDGDSGNDIDNQQDASFLSGSAWSNTYRATDGQITARLTVVSDDGKTASADLPIDFNGSLNRTGAPVAVLQTLPEASADGKIHLSAKGGSIVYNGQSSQGPIVEYRINKDISRGNVNATIDNRTDKSFKTGENFAVSYAPTGANPVAQLLVVTKDGKGSRVQRQIVFDQTDATSFAATLQADKTQVMLGDTVNFSIKLGSGYLYRWDFDGDSQIDEETMEGSASHKYTKEGTFDATVKIVSSANEVAYASVPITVGKSTTDEKQNLPIANFGYTQSGNVVSFTNTSFASPFVQNPELTFSWDFGDNSAKDAEANPTHAYQSTGKFVVLLSATDTAGNQVEKRAEVEITSVPASSTTASKTAITTTNNSSVGLESSSNLTVTTSTSGSIFGTIGKIILWIILMLLLALIGYLVWIKIKYPDFTFKEIIEEEYERLLAFLEGEEYESAYIQHEAKKVHEAAMAPITDAEAASALSASIKEGAPQVSATVEVEEVMEAEVISPTDHVSSDPDVENLDGTNQRMVDDFSEAGASEPEDIVAPLDTPTEPVLSDAGYSQDEVEAARSAAPDPASILDDTPDWLGGGQNK